MKKFVTLCLFALLLAVSVSNIDCFKKERLRESPLRKGVRPVEGGIILGREDRNFMENRIANKESMEKWVSLVGMTKEEAKDFIERDRPDLKVYLIPHGSMVTMDHRTDRVRIFYNEQGKVTASPKIG